MIRAARIHWLGDGELPLYRLGTPDYLWLNVNEDDPPASIWEGRRTYSAERKAIIPLNIDLPFPYFADLLWDWLLDLEDVCSGGTLIFALRTSAILDPIGRVIMAGLGCAEGDVEGAVELNGEDPARLIQELCLRPPRAEGPIQEPVGEFLQKEERDLVNGRARRLLESFLSPEQREELEETRAFHVRAADDRIYRIRYRHQHNVDLIEDGRATIRYCLIMKETVPIFDLMLGQKMLLEKDPETFFRIANAQRLAG